MPTIAESKNENTNPEEVTPATLVVGDVSISDGNIGFDAADGDGIFEDYYIINRYEVDRHVYMMGVTAPNGFNGNSASFVQLAADTMIWFVDWIAEKTGGKPEMPNPEPPDDNTILLDHHYTPYQVVIKADTQTPRWRISGTYVYGFKDPSKVVPTFPRPPWAKDKWNREVRKDKFRDNLKDGGTGEDPSSSSSGTSAADADGFMFGTGTAVTGAAPGTAGAGPNDQG